MYVIIIQARMGSSRLRGKVMRKLLNKEIILWSYDRCLKSNASRVIIVTSLEKDNDILEDFFRKHEILYYRGSENDLLDRYYKTCLLFFSDCLDDLKIIRVTSDCPFVDTEMINDMIDFYENNKFDYIINHSPDGFKPEGSGIEIINFKSLEYLWLNELDPGFREHATGKLSSIDKYNDQISKGFFVYNPIDVNEKMRDTKISIDTEEDYALSKQITEHFQTFDFSYKKILNFLYHK